MQNQVCLLYTTRLADYGTYVTASEGTMHATRSGQPSRDGVGRCLIGELDDALLEQLFCFAPFADRFTPAPPPALRLP